MRDVANDFFAGVLSYSDVDDGRLAAEFDIFHCKGNGTDGCTAEEAQVKG